VKQAGGLARFQCLDCIPFALLRSAQPGMTRSVDGRLKPAHGDDRGQVIGYGGD
jgi:hypothetical protein